MNTRDNKYKIDIWDILIFFDKQNYYQYVS